MQPDPRTTAGWQRPPEPPVTGWWFLVPLLTCGLGAPPMVLAGAVKLRSQLHGMLAGGYFAVILINCGLTAASGDGPETMANALVSAAYAILWIVGTIHVGYLSARVRAEHLLRYPQPRVYGTAVPRTGHVRLPNQPSGTGRHPPAPLTHYPPPPPPWHKPGVDPALARAQWRAERREEARKLQAAQPSMAAELMIGRPDMPGRQYDDGGLVDVNHVPAEHLARHLHIDRPLADEIVAVRDLHHGLSSPDELIVYCDSLTPEKLATFRDRLIFIPR
ncbi:ComEA family DNA-binding protein [Actinoplanes sp. G11-F43]|uniref:ComEA family DNA-binding protein n=1 Tax=Actinoplanes sp. G11-F43 TaxID=3424130 RepID=UPI003D3443E3